MQIAQWIRNRCIQHRLVVLAVVCLERQEEYKVNNWDLVTLRSTSSTNKPQLRLLSLSLWKEEEGCRVMEPRRMNFESCAPHVEILVRR